MYSPLVNNSERIPNNRQVNTYENSESKLEVKKIKQSDTERPKFNETKNVNRRLSSRTKNVLLGGITLGILAAGTYAALMAWNYCISGADANTSETDLFERNSEMTDTISTMVTDVTSSLRANITNILWDSAARVRGDLSRLAMAAETRELSGCTPYTFNEAIGTAINANSTGTVIERCIYLYDKLKYHAKFDDMNTCNHFLYDQAVLNQSVFAPLPEFTGEISIPPQLTYTPLSARMINDNSNEKIASSSIGCKIFDIRTVVDGYREGTIIEKCVDFFNRYTPELPITAESIGDCIINSHETAKSFGSSYRSINLW